MKSLLEEALKNEKDVLEQTATARKKYEDSYRKTGSDDRIKKETDAARAMHI